MTRQCANSSCPNRTDSGLCQTCRVEKNWSDSRDYNPDGTHTDGVSLRDTETTNENSHAQATAEMLANADDETLAEIDGADDDEDEDLRCDGGEPPLSDEWPTDCSNPDWSDNCNGGLETERERKKGLCEGCMAVIWSWSDDGDETDETTEQTTLMTNGGLERFGVDPDEPADDSARDDDAEISEQCRALTANGDRCKNTVTHMTDGAFCSPHSRAENVDTIDDRFEPSHYCEDCEEKLELLYDKRPDDSIPIVCGHYGGTNTRPLEDDGLRADGGTVTDRHGIECPASVDGVDLLAADECPVCASTGTFFEHLAGYYHCDRCYSTWAGDARDASIVDYLEWTENEDEQELVTDGGTQQADRLAGWNPCAASRSGPRYQNCGSQVTKQVARVFGDNRDVIHSCPDCETYREMKSAATGGESDE